MESNNNRKEELFSEVVKAGKRTYFFDVKETRSGDKFVTITESRKIFDDNTGRFYYEKSKMFLYPEDFEKFANGLNTVLRFVDTGEVPERPEQTSETESGDSAGDIIDDEISSINLDF